MNISQQISISASLKMVELFKKCGYFN